ncbi:hypothetical protein K469DRAFT_625884 [Zopfia rhizophila CBS 207.26]|uniref:DUF7702 domain-containing protein n=1 Tax=Zopfia rhizophila CBS 207.26 TaxID=1314779 RepID=A0A6A6EGR9_9PEZI|nr:hypothetical protein K469DRAFT_625884 [Zopfia rhizophila CBS 207.26]
MPPSYRNAIYIPVILFYIPALFGSGFLTWHHGWRSSEIWFVMVTFSLTRLVGASLQLSTIVNPDSYGLARGAAVCAVDGLSPLLFVALGIVGRLQDIVNKTEKTRFTFRDYRLLYLLLTVAMILISVGYAGVTKDEIRNGIRDHSSVSVAAAIMYIISYAGILYGTVSMVLYHLPEVEQGERRLLLMLAISQPLLFIRTLYMCLDVLGNRVKFSPFSGSVTAFLCMALIEEAIVVAMYQAAGFSLRVRSKEEIEQAKKNRHDNGGHRRIESDVELNGQR